MRVRLTSRAAFLTMALIAATWAGGAAGATPTVTHAVSLNVTHNSGTDTVSWSDTATFNSMPANATGKLAGACYVRVYNSQGTYIFEFQADDTQSVGYQSVTSGSQLSISDGPIGLSGMATVIDNAYYDYSGGSRLPAGQYLYRYLVKAWGYYKVNGGTAYSFPTTQYEANYTSVYLIR